MMAKMEIKSIAEKLHAASCMFGVIDRGLDCPKCFFCGKFNCPALRCIDILEKASLNFPIP